MQNYEFKCQTIILQNVFNSILKKIDFFINYVLIVL